MEASIRLTNTISNASRMDNDTHPELALRHKLLLEEHWDINRQRTETFFASFFIHN